MSEIAPPMEEATVLTSVEMVCALAEELTGVVGVAQALVAAGRELDLAGLDGQIGLLCAKTLDLPPEQGRRLRPRLVALAGAVEALSRALATHAHHAMSVA